MKYSVKNKIFIFLKAEATRWESLRKFWLSWIMYFIEWSFSDHSNLYLSVSTWAYPARRECLTCCCCVYCVWWTESSSLGQRDKHWGEVCGVTYFDTKKYSENKILSFEEKTKNPHSYFFYSFELSFLSYIFLEHPHMLEPDLWLCIVSRGQDRVRYTGCRITGDMTGTGNNSPDDDITLHSNKIEFFFIFIRWIMNI